MCRDLLLSLEDVQGLFDERKLSKALTAAELYQQSSGLCSRDSCEGAISEPVNKSSKTTEIGSKTEILKSHLDGILGPELLGTCHNPEVQTGDEFDWYFEEEPTSNLFPAKAQEVCNPQQNDQHLVAAMVCKQKTTQQEKTEDEKNMMKLISALALGLSREDEAVCHISLAALLQFDSGQDISVEKVLFQDVVGPCEDQSTCVSGICFPIVKASNPLLNIGSMGVNVPTTLRCILVESGLKDSKITKSIHYSGLRELAANQTEVCGLGIFFGGRVPISIAEQIRDYGVFLFCDIPVFTIRSIGNQIGTIPLPSLQYFNPLKGCISKAKVTLLEQGWHFNPDAVKFCSSPPKYFGVIQEIKTNPLRSMQGFENEWGQIKRAESKTVNGNHSYVTVILCSPSCVQLQEKKTKIQRVIQKLSKALDSKQCLPGGGALELSCATALMHKAHNLSSVATEEYIQIEAWTAFAEALLDLHRIILFNKGYSNATVDNMISAGMQNLKHQQSTGEDYSQKRKLLSKFPVEIQLKDTCTTVDAPIVLDDHQSRELGFHIAVNLTEQALMAGYFIS